MYFLLFCYLHSYQKELIVSLYVLYRVKTPHIANALSPLNWQWKAQTHQEIQTSSCRH